MYKPLHSSLIIKISDIHGLGLFAKYLIPCGTNLGISHHITTLTKEIIRTPLGGFYNHSDRPNCIKVFKQSLFGDYHVLKTTKDIRQDEEITVKYTLYDIGENNG